MQDFKDEKLVAEYLAGDEKSLETLFRKYLDRLYNFIYSYVGDGAEAEDIAQEAFFRAWKNLKKFDPQKNFRTWLFAIAKNAAVDFMKKKKAIPFSDFSARGRSVFGGENEEGENALAETMEDPAPLPDELFERADAAGAIRRILDKLPSSARAVLHLYYNNQLTFAEIAEVLDEPLNTVKSRHRRSLAELKKMLANESRLDAPK